MYGWFWGHLPGPTPVRILLSVVIIAVLVVVLFLVVFPVIDEMLPIDESEIETAGLGFPGLRGSSA